MTLATARGRIQTKLVLFVVLWLVTVAALFITGNLMYVQLFAIAMGCGVLLELLWSFLIVHQPGWLTFVLAGIEFVAIYAMAKVVDVGIMINQAAVYYLVAWAISQLLILYFLPVWRLRWADEGRELW